MNISQTQALIKSGRKWHYIQPADAQGKRWPWSVCGRQRVDQDGWKIGGQPVDTTNLCTHCRTRKEQSDALSLSPEVVAQIEAIEAAQAPAGPQSSQTIAAEIVAYWFPNETISAVIRHALTQDIAAAITADRQAERDRHAAEVAQVRRDDLEFAADQICQYCSNNQRLYPPDTEYSNYTHEVIEMTGKDHTTGTIHARTYRVICAANILYTMIKDMQPGGWREYKGATND